MLKFDYIVQNPPYKRGLHLDFFKIGISCLSKTGQMIIIQPATWIIKLNHTRNSKMYEELRTLSSNHVKSVYIERMNHEFNIKLVVPLAIIHIDKSKTYDLIDFTCCGEHKQVKTIYDCNLIGENKTVQSILKKCMQYTGVHKLGDHKIVKNNSKLEKIDREKHCCYLKFFLYMPSIHGYNSPGDYIKTKYGYYYGTYTTSCLHKDDTIYMNVQDIPKDKSGTYAPVIYGTRKELENWKHFALNSKLSLFLSMCCSVDQLNQVATYLPFFADHIYTDNEVYHILRLNDEERQLIDDTLVKFKADSPWFKRFMEGKNWEKICKNYNFN